MIESFAGFGVGFLVGLTGIGGGALMTPLLILIFGYAPITAVGTDLLYATITKMVGMTVHGRQGTVDWVVVRRLACGSLPSAVLMLFFLSQGQGDKQSAHGLVGTIAVALLITAIGLLTKPVLHRLGRLYRIDRPEIFKALQPGLTVVAGLIIGALVTATSIGAGALGAVVLLYLYPLRLTPAKMVGTDLAHAIPLALVAGVGHLGLGNVDLALLGKLLLGSVPGVLLGGYVCLKLPEKAMRIGIALVLLTVSVRLLHQEFGSI